MGHKVDIKFIKPFVDSTIHALQVQCQLEVKPGKPSMKEQASPEYRTVAIAGLIGITADAFNGSILIGFPTATFLGVMGKMLGETFSELTPDLEDGAGELINIIFGGAKRTLSDSGYVIQKALPSVIRGEKLTVSPLSKSPAVVIPFQTSVGIFFIEVGLEAFEGAMAA